MVGRASHIWEPAEHMVATGGCDWHERSGCFKQDRKVGQTPLEIVSSWQTR